MSSSQIAKATVARDQALDVINYLLQDMTLKGACELVGITPNQFGRTVSEFPELLIEMNRVHVAKVTGMMDKIYGESEKNLETFVNECNRIRGLLEQNDPMIDRKEQLDMLVKLDKYIQSVIQKLTPILKDIPEKAPDESAVMDANRILRDMQGADLKKVVMTVSVERHHLLDDDGEILEGEEATSDQAPTDSLVRETVLHPTPELRSSNAQESRQSLDGQSA